MRFFFLLALMLVSPRAFAVTVEEMLAKVDSNLTFDTRESWVTMVVTRGERVKTYKLHSFGRGADEAAVEYLEPARDKGTKMLKKKDELWMWMPSVEKTQKISGHMLRQSMMGSDMSYEDMMQASSWRAVYGGEVTGEDVVDGRKAWKVDLKAKVPDATYARRLVWVDQETYIPLRQELYAVSGMLLKTWTMSGVRDFGARKFPTLMVVEDKVQKGSRTEMKFDEIKFAVPLQEEVFSTRWLER